MKNVIALALLSTAALLPKAIPAQLTYTPDFQLAQYTVPPVPVRMTCNVNGVNYPVDFAYRIWGTNGSSWFIIGQVVAGPIGPIAVRNDGAQFPASC